VANIVVVKWFLSHPSLRELLTNDEKCRLTFQFPLFRFTLWRLITLTNHSFYKQLYGVDYTNLELSVTIKPVLNGSLIKRNFVLNGNIFRSCDCHIIPWLKGNLASAKNVLDSWDSV
jgi:hypothetical protein